MEMMKTENTNFEQSTSKEDKRFESKNNESPMLEVQTVTSTVNEEQDYICDKDANSLKDILKKSEKRKLDERDKE